MGYRDDFYTVENIIGYTGNLNDFPTIYFRKLNMVTDQTMYGHITQRHIDSTNVGRMAVDSAKHYQIRNERVGGVTGEMKSIERRDGQIFHESRSQFTPIPRFGGGAAGAAARAIAAQAIRNCQQEKYISVYSGADFDVMDDIIDLKAELMKDI